MAICSKCGKENLHGLTSCAQCGAALPDADLTRENSEAGEQDNELVLLANFHTVAEANMVQELLETNGIACVMHGETDPIGTRSGAEPISLLVEKQDSASASELYEAYFAGDAVVQEDSRPAEGE